MVEPYLLPWILMTVALAMAAGIGLLFLMLCIVLGSPHIGFNNLRTLGIWTPIIWTLAAIPLTSVLILRRHVFLRQERSRQWVWATTVLGITTGLLALFLVSISR
jgi:hypothetical protein